MMDYLPYIVLAVVAFFLWLQWRMHRAAKRIVGQTAPTTDESVADGISVYYFHSPNCGPCRAMSPMVERLAREHSGLLSVDVTQQAEVASRFRVMGTPTFVRVVDGRIDDVVLGAVSEKRLRRMLA